MGFWSVVVIVVDEGGREGNCHPESILILFLFMVLVLIPIFFLLVFFLFFPLGGNSSLPSFLFQIFHFSLFILHLISCSRPFYPFVSKKKFFYSLRVVSISILFLRFSKCHFYNLEFYPSFHPIPFSISPSFFHPLNPSHPPNLPHSFRFSKSHPHKPEFKFPPPPPSSPPPHPPIPFKLSPPSKVHASRFWIMEGRGGGGQSFV